VLKQLFQWPSLVLFGQHAEYGAREATVTVRKIQQYRIDLLLGKPEEHDHFRFFIGKAITDGALQDA
jgi:hypothetical protein